MGAIQIARAVADAIRELGSVPSGHLYANLMPSGMTLGGYTAVIDLLKRSGLVTEAGHVLTWAGPSK